MKLKPFGNIIEGPQGLRMPETLARQIEDAGKGLPKEFQFRRMAKSATEMKLEDGSRTDVSIITTDAVDHQKEVVLPGGIDFSVFWKNPIVPFGHNYEALPVGKCVWSKAVANGIAAKTQYAIRPPSHQGDWLPDAILALLQQGMLPAKSIGFVPTHMRSPTPDDIAKRPEWKNADVIIDSAVLLEYSVVTLGCNPEALEVAVSKALTDKGMAAMILKANEPAGAIIDEGDMPACPKCMSNANVSQKDDTYQCSICSNTFKPGDTKTADLVTPFVSPRTIADYRKRQLAGLGELIQAEARAKIADAIDRMRGRA